MLNLKQTPEAVCGGSEGQETYIKSDNDSNTQADLLKAYKKAGLWLVPLPPEPDGQPSKQGKTGWTKPYSQGNPYGYSDDPAIWRGWLEQGWNVGIFHEASRTVALDIDALAETRRLFKMAGIPLEDWLGNPQYLQIKSGAANRGKLLFRLPDGVKLPKRAFSMGGKPLFEIRCGKHQDVCPPSIHPTSGKAYECIGDPSKIPPCPPEPIDLSQQWGAWEMQLKALATGQGLPPAKPDKPATNTPSPALAMSGGASVIEQFRARYSFADILPRYGYTFNETIRKWLYAQSGTGQPGISVLADGNLIQSHHAADPLNTGKALDVFEAYCILEHSGDKRAATKAAARELGMDSPTRANRQSKLATPPKPALPESDGKEDDDGLALLCGSSIKPQPISWLWHGWLAAGKFHVLAGPPGSGKTTLALAMAATLTSAGRWPDGTRAGFGNVLIWSGEDDPQDTLIPRLLAMQADTGRIYFVGDVYTAEGRRAFDPAVDMDRLAREAVKVGNVKLLIVDPVVSSILGDSHKNAEVRRGLQPLVDLAGILKCAVLGISHFSKNTAGRDPVERVTGSIAFGALARIVMGAAKLPDNEGGGRLLVRAKSNIGIDGGGFKYDLRQEPLAGYPGMDASCVLWGEAVTGPAAELLGKADPPPADGADGAAKEEAIEWLTDTLRYADMDGKRLKAMATEAGISHATLHRAAKELGVKTSSGGFGKPRIWSLEPSMCIKPPHLSQPLGYGTDDPPMIHMGDGGETRTANILPASTQNNSGILVEGEL